MISRKVIDENRVLCLFWKTNKKGASRKLGYIFSNGSFLVPMARGTDVLKRLRARGKVEVRLNGSSQACRPKVIDKFELTKRFLKKGAERLAGKKFGPSSKLIQKLDQMAERHVVVELKPVRS